MHSSLSFVRFFAILTVVRAAAATTSPDFIVVGGGTAGCVISARLCEQLPHANIVLLERGVERDGVSEFLVRAPRNAPKSWSSPDVSEFFFSEPDPGLGGRQNFITTGKTLGGSSSTNGMQWTIPLGDATKGWGIQGLSHGVARRFFRKAYRKVGFEQQPPALRQIYGDDFVEAATKAGFNKGFKPFDDRVRKAIWEMAVSITPTGRRIDSCTAYLTPALQGRCRGNLELIQGVTVTRILLDDSTTPRATGVEYVLSSDTELNNKIVLQASKEVILSAGPYGSPKLLQLSGIGPDAHLRQANVETRVDLPVGQRTQARPLTAVASEYKGVPLEPSNNSTVLESEETFENWERGEPSALGTTGLPTIAVLKDLGYSTMATATSAVDTPVLQSFCLANPSSFGYLRIKDANPFTTPKVFLNLLGNNKELSRLRICMKKFLEVHSKLPDKFQLVNISPAHGVNETFIRETATFAVHFVAGCAVGSVLQPNLTVKGVSGLRVIDASVFRTMPASAGPMASTYMLAEFASDRLVRKYRYCGFGLYPSCGRGRSHRARGEW